MRLRPTSLLVTALALSACSSGTSGSPPVVGTDVVTVADRAAPPPDVVVPDDDVIATVDVVEASDVATEDAPAPVDVPVMESRSVDFPTQTIMPGQEVTRCREVRLGNVAPMLIRSIRVSIPRGSHHVIVYRSRADAEQPTPTQCQGLSGILAGTAPIFIAQQYESGIDFPDGIGLSIAANQMIRIEEHFINTTSAPIMAGATVRFELSNGVGLTPADMMFWGTQNINVAPRSMSTSQYFRPALPDINVFGLTSHTHQAGVLATVEVASAASGGGREVHRSDNWQEPPLTLFAPPLRFGAGEGLRLTCRYNNLSDRTLRFGESFNQEMCFLWAYYYPSQGFHVCFDGICRALRL